MCTGHRFSSKITHASAKIAFLMKCKKYRNVANILKIKASVQSLKANDITKYSILRFMSASTELNYRVLHFFRQLLHFPVINIFIILDNINCLHILPFLKFFNWKFRQYPNKKNSN